MTKTKATWKRWVRVVDIFLEHEFNPKARSTVGGLLTIACVVAMIVYISYVFATEKKTFRNTTFLVDTAAKVYVVELNNTLSYTSNATYTFPPGSPCYQAIQANAEFSHVLDWTASHPFTIPQGVPIRFPICQQYSLLEGLESVNEFARGLRIFTERPVGNDFWLTVISPDGTVFPLPHTFPFRSVPVRMNLQKQTDQDGNTVLDRWEPSLSTGFGFDEKDCSFLVFGQTCESVIVTLQSTFRLFGVVEEPVDPVDWYFDRLVVITLILTAGTLLKRVFRKTKRAVRSYKESAAGAKEQEYEGDMFTLEDCSSGFPDSGNGSQIPDGS